MEKVIDINKIYLDSKNPRLLDEGNSERDIILSLLEEKKNRNKVLTLMESIARQGLSPIDKIAVLKEEEETYIVKEGNRRVLALKLFQDPEMVKEEYNDFYIKIKALRPRLSITTINCEVLSQEELHYWMKLKHTGENQGAGVVKWDSLGIKSFQERENGEKHDIQEIIEIFKQKSKMNNKIKGKIKYLKGSILERLVSDPEIKKELGVKKEDKKLIIERLNLDFLDKLFYDLIINKITAKEIRYKKDREDYILKVYGIEIPLEYYIKDEKDEKNEKNIIEAKIDKEVHVKNSIITENEKKGIENDFKENNLEEKNNMSTKHISQINLHTNDRNCLIPKNFILNISDPKINNLYNELRKCPIDGYVAIISSSFRVFLELTLEFYISKNESLRQKRSTLLEKFSRIINHLENEKIITESQRKNLEVVANNDKSFMSLKSLNALVHTQLIATPLDLKVIWDNYQILFEKIYQK